MAEICCPSLDEAWLLAVKIACSSRRREVSPLVVAFDVTTNQPAPQCQALHSELNVALAASGHATVETVANTLFPRSLWDPSRPREQLFKRYMKILPTLRRDVRNHRGLYFERLISYPGTRGETGKNQLDHIAKTFTSGNHRRSALQASVFCPLSDLNDSRRQGFPCLQQIAFAHNQSLGSLTVVAFYATQYLFERAYGNYLGLMRLGEFMAHEMGLKLERVICVAAIAQLDAPANQVRSLLRRFLAPAQAGSERSLARL